MGSITYQIGRALRGLTGRPLALAFTLAAVALTFLLLGGVFLVAQNLSRLTGRWGSGATVAVDLAPKVPPADAARVAQALRETRGVQKVHHVSPADSRGRLQANLGPDADILKGVEEELFPRSYEVRIAGDRATVIDAQRRLARMAGVVPGVEAVHTVDTWFHRLDRVIAGIRIAGGVLGLLVLLACAYIIMVTIRLRFVDRSQELAIQRLMGATERFLRTPYLIEGVIQGAIGAALAIGLLFGLHEILLARSASLFGEAVDPARLGFLPARDLAYGLVIGALCGLLGGVFATRKAAHGT